jgi:hypothetical protein
MEIRLRVDRLQPPAGKVTRVAAAGSLPEDPGSSSAYERSFTGWLELLAALSDMMDGAGDRQ